MGLRQPSSTGAFFAQAKAGAQQQEEARKKLQKPQALGGSSQMGTAMVAAQTQAQQGATQNVQATGQQAAKDLTAKKEALTSSTAQTIAGTPVTPTTPPGGTQTIVGGAGSDAISGGTPSTTPSQPIAAISATGQAFTGGISGPVAINPKIKETQDNIVNIQKQLTELTNQPTRTLKDMLQKFNKVSGLTKQLSDNKILLSQLNVQSGLPSVEGIGDTGDLSAVENIASKIRENIDTVTAQKNELDKALLSANAEDAKKITAEKERLDALLKSYQDQLTTGNLGKIAGASTPETEFTTRESLLAGEGQNVGKLASIFGPGWNRKYGGLESQIYGKDLEAIQEAAKSGLEQKAVAERGTDVALEGYSKTLAEGKKGYEESIKTAQDRLSILKKTPEELAGYTKDELKKMFDNNDALINKLFKFDKDGKVIGTQVSETRTALQDRLTKLGAEKEKIGGETTKAQNVRTAKVDEASKAVEGLATGWNRDFDKYLSSVDYAIKKIDDNSGKWFGGWKGMTDDSYKAKAVKSMINDYKKEITRLQGEAKKAKDEQNLNKLNEIKDQINNYSRNQIKMIRDKYNSIQQEALS